MTEYLIKTKGCDGSTCVIVALDDVELAAVQRVAMVITKRGGGCQPTLSVTPVADADEFDLENAGRETEA